MPFTPAHVAAVLPWVGSRRPRWAVPSALVIGSMVPDVLYFVPISSNREFSHSLVGVLTLDLALGLLFVGLWRVVAAPVARDLALEPVRAKVPGSAALSAREWLWAVPCVVLGSVTHVVWDAFTHVGGWVVRRVPALTETLALGLPAFKLAQYASGVLGVAVVAAYVVRVLAHARADHSRAPLATPRERRMAWLVLVVAPMAAGLAFALQAVASGTSTEMLLYVVVVRGVSGLGLAVTAVALWWHLRVRPRATPQVVSRPTPTGGASDRTR